MHVNRICVCLRSRAPRTVFFFSVERRGEPQTRRKVLKSSSRPFSARCVFFACDRWLEQFLFISRKSSAYQSCAYITHINCKVYQEEKRCSRCRTQKTTVLKQNSARGKGGYPVNVFYCCCPTFWLRVSSPLFENGAEVERTVAF